MTSALRSGCTPTKEQIRNSFSDPGTAWDIKAIATI